MSTKAGQAHKGVVERTVRPTSRPSVEYALTEVGAELIPVVETMVRVGARLEAQRQT